MWGQNFETLLNSSKSFHVSHERNINAGAEGRIWLTSQEINDAINHTIIRAVFVCSLFPLRSFGGSSPNLMGSFFEKVNGSLSLSTILYMRQPHATQLQKAPFACCCRVYFGAFYCTASQWCMYVDLTIALEGFFFEKVNRSMGQRVKRVKRVDGSLSLSLYYI